MGRVEMNCSNAFKIISLVVDGEATEYQKRLLDFHLMGCSTCRKAMSICRDISEIARKLPAPTPPADLEHNIREMLKMKVDIRHPEHRFRNAFLALPAVAALLIFAFAILPFAGNQESITETQGIGITLHESKNTDIRISSKSGIRTAPLSDYSRQASLISF
jgi:predicted anti-sigma-YlaC factor YlaD